MADLGTIDVHVQRVLSTVGCFQPVIDIFSIPILYTGIHDIEAGFSENTHSQTLSMLAIVRGKVGLKGSNGPALSWGPWMHGVTIEYFTFTTDL